MKYKLFVKNYLLVVFLLILNTNIFGQEVPVTQEAAPVVAYSQAQQKVIQQAQTEATGAPTGMFFTFDTVLDPLRLLDGDVDPAKPITGLQKIDPTVKIALGYESPWFLQNYLRVALTFDFHMRYQFMNNNIISDYKKFLSYDLTMGFNITPYFYAEFDARGLGKFALSYAHRVGRYSHFLYQVDTSVRVWGNLYDTEGVIQDIAWQYTTLDISHFFAPTVPQYIHSISIETRLRLRLQNNAFDPQTHPDTGHSFNSEVPNWNELMYVSLRMQFDIWFNPYIALRPHMELVVDGFEFTTKSNPFGLNLGISMQFLI